MNESAQHTHIDTVAFAATRMAYDAEHGEGAFELLALSDKLAACKRAAGLAPELVEDIASASTERPSLVWRLPDGLHENIPADEYHVRELGLVNKGALDQVDHAPSVYEAWVKGLRESEDTPALRFGAALHCALLEPYVFATTYAIRPEYPEPPRPLGDDGKPLDFRLKANAEAKAAYAAELAAYEAKVAAWEAEHAKHIVLDKEDAARIVRMVAALRAHPKASKLLQEGKGVREAVLRWTDEETGLACKGRVDLYREDLRALIDLKSTQDARESAFAASCARYRYDVQQAFYTDGMRAIGKPVDVFAFVVVEKEYPHLVGVYTLGPESDAAGRRKMRANLETLRECLDAGEFPGLPVEVTEIEMPRWAL